jgi:hypothetical protein
MSCHLCITQIDTTLHVGWHLCITQIDTTLHVDSHLCITQIDTILYVSCHLCITQIDTTLHVSCHLRYQPTYKSRDNLCYSDTEMPTHIQSRVDLCYAIQRCQPS